MPPHIAKQLIIKGCKDARDRGGYATLHDAMAVLENPYTRDGGETLLGGHIYEDSIADIKNVVMNILWINFDFSAHDKFAAKDKGAVMRAIAIKAKDVPLVHNHHKKLYDDYQRHTSQWTTLTDVFRCFRDMEVCLLVLDPRIVPAWQEQLQSTNFYEANKLGIIYQDCAGRFVLDWGGGSGTKPIDQLVNKHHKSFTPYIEWISGYRDGDTRVAAYMGVRDRYREDPTIVWSAALCSVKPVSWMDTIKQLHNEYKLHLYSRLQRAVKDRVTEVLVRIHLPEAVRANLADSIKRCKNGQKVQAGRIELSDVPEESLGYVLEAIKTHLDDEEASSGSKNQERKNNSKSDKCTMKALYRSGPDGGRECGTVSPQIARLCVALCCLSRAAGGESVAEDAHQYGIDIQYIENYILGSNDTNKKTYDRVRQVLSRFRRRLCPLAEGGDVSEQKYWQKTLRAQVKTVNGALAVDFRVRVLLCGSRAL